MADGARRQRRGGAASPAAPAAPDLLQQLRALGLNQSRAPKTYAGMAAGRSSALGQVPDAGGYSSRDRSAFFSRSKAGGADTFGSKASLEHHLLRGATPPGGLAGSVTPPSRPKARAATPDTAASPFVEDDALLFHMSGLKPLRTASRMGAAGAARNQQAAAAAAAQHRSRLAGRAAPQAQHHMPATAAAAEAAPGHEAPLPIPRAFSFAGEPSPRVNAAPLPTERSREAAAAVAPAAAHCIREEDGVAVLIAGGSPSSSCCQSSTGVDSAGDIAAVDAAAAAGAAAGLCADSPSTDAAQGEATEPTEAAVEADETASEMAMPGQLPPGWSEELLSWMLSEKAGLLVEAQRAQRRQQELAAELERLQARGSGAEQEAQRLLAERRSLLDRVQRLSAAEAEAAATVERLRMENDALAVELERSQEVCREMLAARRAARDALSEMSAQNARLLAAYVEKKQEAAQLKEALRRQQRHSEARIQALEAQLQAVQAAGRALPNGRLHSPPASPPQPQGASAAYPLGASAHLGYDEDHEGGLPEGPISSSAAELGGLGLGPDHNAHSSEDSGERLAYIGSAEGSVYGSPEHPAAAQPPNNENANAAGNENASSGRQQGRRAGKAQWDEERSELLSLLERLQDQLSARAEQQQQAGATPSKPGTASRPQQRGSTPISSFPSPQPAPFCCGSSEVGGEETPFPAAAFDAAGNAGCQVPGSRRSGWQAASNLEASFESAGSSSSSGDVFGGGLADPSSDSSTETCDGGSPAVMAHHVADTPTSAPPHSVARSGAPSPPSARQRAAAGATTPCAVPTAPASTPASAIQPAAQEAQQQRQGAKSPSVGSLKLESFFPPMEPSGTSSISNAQAAADQQRLQEAEQRAAELQAELERMREAAAVAEERAAREERRRCAEAAKAAGNAAFQAQRYEEAVQHYSAGLEAGAARENAALAAVLHCNRAAALHACGRYLDALADCYRAEALDASYSRVYHRRADAYWALGAYDAAAQDLAELLKLGAGQDVASRLADAQRRAQAQQPVNHYAVLGVQPAATRAEVVAAYRSSARRFHPDKAAAAEGLSAAAAEAIFKLLSEAYRVLADSEQRRHHDIAALRHKYRRFYSYAL